MYSRDRLVSRRSIGWEGPRDRSGWLLLVRLIFRLYFFLLVVGFQKSESSKLTTFVLLCRGEGMVEYATQDEAEEAMELLNGAMLLGYPVRIHK